MQNIKVCPKCNQVSADATKSFCPYDGTALVEMQPLQVQQKQQPDLIQSRLASKPSPAKSKKMHPLAVVGFSIIGVVFFAGVLSAMLEDFKKKGLNSSSNSAISTTEQTNKKETQPLALANSTPLPTPLPSTLSSTENLEAGKKALSNGDLSAAREHLSAISKEAKEFASAKQYLATLEKRERRESVEYDLRSVEGEQAANERALDLYENMEGSIGKGSYLNALKKKGELQLRHIQLERKLKSMP